MNPLAAAQTYLVRPNNNSDATAYGQQNMTGTAAVGAAVRTTGSGIWLSDAAITSANYMFADMTLKSRSGTVRTALVKSANNINQTSINSVNLAGWSWIDTSASVTSLMLTGVMGSSNVMLFARKPAGSDSDATGIPTGDLDVQGDFTADVMQKVYETDLTASANSINITGLNGNTDILYNLIINAISCQVGADYVYARLNNDSAANSIGLEEIYGSNATTSAIQYSTLNSLNLAYFNAINTSSLDSVLIFAKSGGPRILLGGHNWGISGTTISSVWKTGQVWIDTSANITSIFLYTGVANNIGSTSHVELWALKKSI
jgi:hypothetical protein